MSFRSGRHGMDVWTAKERGPVIDEPVWILVDEGLLTSKGYHTSLRYEERKLLSAGLVKLIKTDSRHL